MAVLKCAGPYVTSCYIDDTGGYNGIFVDQSNWAIIGWETTSTQAQCFGASPSGSYNIQYIAFINDFANGCSNNGFGTYNYDGNRNLGVDEQAFVGVIAYKAAQGTVQCNSGVSVYEPATADHNSGTHVFVAGVIAISNIDGACNGGAPTDGEGVIFDNWDCSQNGCAAYPNQGVMEQVLSIGNGGMGVEVYSNSAASTYITSTTTYNNIQSANNPYSWIGELLLNSDSGTVISATGNIFVSATATTSHYPIYGCTVGGSNGTVSVSGNVCYNIAASNQTELSSGNTGFSFGTNVTTNPNFVSPSIPGAPNCSTSATVIACLSTVITGFVPQASGAVGLGYHAPGPCAPDAYFPPWLKCPS
jgi:hypothetical protein